MRMTIGDCVFHSQVVAPTIANPACQEQLVDAAKLVAKSVENVVGTAQGACKDDKALQGLGEAATSVTKALNDLLQHIRRGVPIEKHVCILHYIAGAQKL